jgi:hypothetical protein
VPEGSDFILSITKYGSEGHGNVEGKSYVFPEGLPGYRQLLEAGSGRFLAYHTRNFAGEGPKGAFVGYGDIEEIRDLGISRSDEEEGGTRYFEARLSGYQRLPSPVSGKRKPDYINKQHSIAKVAPEDFQNLVKLGEGRERSIHLLFKWSPDREPKTLEFHREIAEQEGAVWWGQSKGNRSGRLLRQENLDQIRDQIQAGRPTYVFFYGNGEAWRASLEAITDDRTEIQEELIPDYYRAEDSSLFVKVSSFEELPPEFPENSLRLVQRPHADSADMRGSLGNQRTPLLVYRVEEVPQQEEEESSAPYPFSWLLEVTNWDEGELNELVDALRGQPKQVILAGPPGTGKTYLARSIAHYLTGARPGAFETVQFHPTYGYEEFVEGLRPEVHDQQMRFSVRPGVVRELVARIEEAGDETPYVLVIDEMNRAHLSRVLGELMYLLEYREASLTLPFSQKEFSLPPNLSFIGTMNTADRSIRSIDIALRRRFEVFECPPDGEILRGFYEKGFGESQVPDLIEGFEKLNEDLTSYLDRHHTIGHTFFMKEALTPTTLRRIWKRQIGPLIEEYFFDQPDVADQFSPEAYWSQA